VGGVTALLTILAASVAVLHGIRPRAHAGAEQAAIAAQAAEVVLSEAVASIERELAGGGALDPDRQVFTGRTRGASYRAELVLLPGGQVRLTCLGSAVDLEGNPCGDPVRLDALVTLDPRPRVIWRSGQ
jgi:hypothetical protein